MRRIGTILATLAVALAVPASTLAAGTLDQEQANHSSSGGWYDGSPLWQIAQTFTAGATGTIDSVSIYAGVEVVGGAQVGPAVAGDLSVEIWATSGNVPVSPALAQRTVTPAWPAGWFDVSFASPASVVSGTQYAIVLVTDAGATRMQWPGNCAADAYAGGEALWRHGGSTWALVHDSGNATVCQYDFAFRTYVTPNATQPPTTTSTDRSGGNRGDALPLLAAILAAVAAAALVTVRRLEIVRR